jgi:hypothetical protein
MEEESRINNQNKENDIVLGNTDNMIGKFMENPEINKIMQEEIMRAFSQNKK